MNGQDMKPVAPPHNYAAVSVSNVAATFCQYEALKHVSFPLQTLGKCAKMIPVMVWGTLIMRKKYGARDYGNAVLITAGCTLFLMTGEVRSKHAAADSSALGVMLMLGYLGFDGFTSTFQDKLFKGYQMTIYNQILYVTSFSAVFSALGERTAGLVLERTVLHILIDLALPPLLTPCVRSCRFAVGWAAWPRAGVHLAAP